MADFSLLSRHHRPSSISLSYFHRLSRLHLNVVYPILLSFVVLIALQQRARYHRFDEISPQFAGSPDTREA